MFKKIKNWIVVKWKYLLVILGLSVSIVFAAGELPKENLGNSLDLKAPKENILWSNKYTEYEYEDGEIISQKQIVSYAYKSNELAPVFKDEIIEKRTENIVTRNFGGNKRSAQSGYSFYKENGDWKKIKFATTTPEVFNQVSWLDRFIAWAADTGATSPGTMANDNAVGFIAWTNPDNAKVSDDSRTTADTAAGASYYLKATNFGFSIPSYATIDGIVVEIERKSEAGGNSKDKEVKIVKSDGSIGATNKLIALEWSSTEAYFSYGANNDLWDESWSDTDINNSNFGMVLQAQLHIDLSLEKNTLVSTINGKKKISDIKIGDKVYSFNEQSNQIEEDEVIGTHYNSIKNGGSKYYYIYLENGQLVKATYSHLFYANKKWEMAKNLKVGDILKNEKLEDVKISKIEIVKNDIDEVWGLTVKNNHNFFANGILVHNQDARVDHIRITVYYTEGLPPVLPAATGINIIMIE